MKKIRILIADDHAVLRAGLRMLINSQEDLEVIGEAADGAEAVEQAGVLQPDLVLMDITMPGGGGIPAIPAVLKACPNTRVLVLTMHDDATYLRATMEAGATGYLVKSAADTELLIAIRTVAAGRTFVDLPGFAMAAPDALATGPRTEPAGPRDQPSPLSEREHEVLALVAQGHSNREVADRLGISIKTVETYRARLMEKLELRSRADLVRYALEKGLLLPDKT
ncbi:MAG: response regulator transcription factor [Nitrospirales bacterium]|nr:response regulator transcription factor [Nitrospirales bacterium]